MTRGEQDARGEQVRGSVPVGETGQALLEALLTVSPVGLHVLDTELRVVRINTATPAMRGVRAQDLLGRRLTEAYGLVDPDGMEALARGVLETGLPVLDRIVRIRPPEEPDDERFHSISAFRLADRRGRALGPAVAAVDVTDRERARGGLALLEAVHRGVGRTLDTVVTCRELADVLVPAFAEVPEGGVLVLAGLPDADGDPAGPRGDALPGPPDGAPPGLRAALRKSPVGGAGPLQDLCDEIVYRRDQAAGRADGAVLLLARTRAFPADRVAAWPLEADLAAVAVARRHVRARLRDWGWTRRRPPTPNSSSASSSPTPSATARRR